MKLWSLRILIFFFTLGVGLTVARFFLSAGTKLLQERYECNLRPVTDAGNTDFLAEFRELPSLDDYYVYRKPKGRLIHFIEDGLFRQSEIVADDGESWLVLNEPGEVVSLKRSIAQVKKLKSVSWPGEEPDAKLSFRSVEMPVLALKPLDDALKPGPVESLFRNGVDGEEISEAYVREFVLGETRFRLRSSFGVTHDNEQLAVLVLESGGINQVIEQRAYTHPPERNIIGNLLWAGDLDADGKLDLYFDEFNEKGYTNTKLFLSSLAGPGELVGFFGSFGAAGC